MNKEFFTIVKEHSTFSFRYCSKVCCEFYQALYSNPLPTPQTFQIQDTLLEKIPSKFTKLMNMVLKDPIIEI